mmetsp:Transcript_58589/g.168212  ORF Transcript_58589/g.168212 Transcript_58589/m.168212 type:complete len:508 (+) Transcript_58589:835-2358(+)
MGVVVPTEDALVETLQPNDHATRLPADGQPIHDHRLEKHVATAIEVLRVGDLDDGHQAGLRIADAHAQQRGLVRREVRNAPAVLRVQALGDAVVASVLHILANVDQVLASFQELVEGERHTLAHQLRCRGDLAGGGEACSLFGNLRLGHQRLAIEAQASLPGRDFWLLGGFVEGLLHHALEFLQAPQQLRVASHALRHGPGALARQSVVVLCGLDLCLRQIGLLPVRGGMAKPPRDAAEDHRRWHASAPSVLGGVVCRLVDGGEAVAVCIEDGHAQPLLGKPVEPPIALEGYAQAVVGNPEDHRALEASMLHILCQIDRAKKVGVVDGPIPQADVAHGVGRQEGPLDLEVMSESQPSSTADGRTRLRSQSGGHQEVVRTAAEQTMVPPTHGILGRHAEAAGSVEQHLVHGLPTPERADQGGAEVPVVQCRGIRGPQRQADAPQEFLSARADGVESFTTEVRHARLRVQQEGRQPGLQRQLHILATEPGLLEGHCMRPRLRQRATSLR